MNATLPLDTRSENTWPALKISRRQYQFVQFVIKWAKFHFVRRTKQDDGRNPTGLGNMRRASVARKKNVALINNSYHFAQLCFARKIKQVFFRKFIKFRSRWLLRKTYHYKFYFVIDSVLQDGYKVFYRPGLYPARRFHGKSHNNIIL